MNRGSGTVKAIVQGTIAIVLSLGTMPVVPAVAQSPPRPQPSPDPDTGTEAAPDSPGLCPIPALERVRLHRVVSGETLDSIAAAYNLLPVTLLGMNPGAQPGALSPGMPLRIPPFNGIEVQVPQGATWDSLGTMYQMRADVLFEVNGCPETVPDRIFVPGINWFPGIEGTFVTNGTGAEADPLTGYPLSEPGAIVRNFGWQTHPDRDELVFSSGITLSVTPEATVLAVGAGTVAFVGEDDALGTLIVINHAQGFQTRYGGVTAPQVRVGQRVSAGTPLSTPTPASEDTATLYFEVRTNSALGWVARDPGDYIPGLAVR